MSRSSWRGSAEGRVTAPEVNFRVPSRRLEWSWGWGEHRDGGRSGLGVLRCPGIGFPMFHICSAAASNICLLTDDKKKKGPDHTFICSPLRWESPKIVFIYSGTTPGPWGGVHLYEFAERPLSPHRLGCDCGGWSRSGQLCPGALCVRSLPRGPPY